MASRVAQFGWRIFKALFRAVGLDVFLKRPGYVYVLQKPNHHYVPDYYGKTAVKQEDIRTLPIFGPLAEKVIQHQKTLLYYDRLYTLYQVLKNFANVSQSGKRVNFAEVGVYKGGTSYFIASTAKALGFKGAVLHCFDTFEGHSREDVRTEIDPFHKPADFNDVEFRDVQQYLEEFDNVVLHKGRFQDTCSSIKGQKFHFVHLDVDIYEPTSFALDFFDHHLAAQGIVVVDDYGFSTCPGVKKAVDEFIGERSDYFLLQPLTGQGILIKRS